MNRLDDRCFSRLVCGGWWRLVFLVVLGACATGCGGVFFYPMRGYVYTPEQLGLRYENIYFVNGDGQRLHGWLLLARQPSRGTVLFLHGNAENISTHIRAIDWLPSVGYDVFLFDYRGFGQSEGDPTIAGALDDIESALGLVARDARFGNRDVAIYGQSLGAALGIHASAHSAWRGNIRAVVAESAFSDYRAIVRETLASAWLTLAFQWPVSSLMNNDYSPIESVGLLSPIPVLVIHGDQDRIVPAYHGAFLYDAARQPKELWIIPNGQHAGAMRSYLLRARLRDYLDKKFSSISVTPGS
jgi:hypothetical protein